MNKSNDTHSQHTQHTQHKPKLNKIKIKIGDYFKCKNLDGTDEINVFKKQNEETFVNTPTGLAPVLSMVKKEKNRIIEIKTKNRSAKIAERHIFPQKDGSNEYAIDAEFIMTIDGEEKIISKQFIKEDYVYDISIPKPHVYYSANGILHHNTALKVFFARQMLFKKKNVLFISLEMPKYEIMKRIDASILGCEIGDLQTMDQELLSKKINDAAPLLGDLRVVDYNAGTLNSNGIKSLLDDLKIKEGFVPDCIFVDYIGLMTSAKVSDAANSYDKGGAVAEDLHGIAKSTYDSNGNKGVMLFTSTQTNRASYNTVEADAANISESMKIFMTADYAMMLLSTDVMKDQNQQMWKIIKNRWSGDMSTMIVQPDFARVNYTEYNDAATTEIQMDKIEEQVFDTGLDFGSIG